MQRIKQATLYIRLCGARGRALGMSIAALFVIALMALGTAGIAHASPGVSSAGESSGAQLTHAPDKPYIASHGTLVSRVRVPATITKDAHGATTIQPDWFCNCYEIKNVKAAGTGWRFLGASRGSSPTTSVSITINQTVSNSYSANVGVSADSVSAGVGFSVTQTYGVSQTGSANIPAGQTIEIDAYAVYNVSTYDVWWNPALGGDYKVGSGNAWHYTGVIEFDTWRVN